jgi:hypothetical protein
MVILLVGTVWEAEEILNSLRWNKYMPATSKKQRVYMAKMATAQRRRANKVSRPMARCMK